VPGHDDLILNHVLRAAVATELAANDRPRHRRLRAEAWRRLRDELAEAPDGDLWRYTADMLYLLDRPAVRDAFFPPSAPVHSVDPAQPADAMAIAAIAERHVPECSTAVSRTTSGAAPSTAGWRVSWRTTCWPAGRPPWTPKRDSSSSTDDPSP
jgi:hypothetical protein